MSPAGLYGHPLAACWRGRHTLVAARAATGGRGRALTGAETGYFLGVDIGTTSTAAAVWRDGRGDVANLGNRAASIPSVVLLRDDGAVLVGEAAVRRANHRTGPGGTRVQPPGR